MIRYKIENRKTEQVSDFVYLLCFFYKQEKRLKLFLDFSKKREYYINDQISILSHIEKGTGTYGEKFYRTRKGKYQKKFEERL